MEADSLPATSRQISIINAARVATNVGNVTYVLSEKVFHLSAIHAENAVTELSDNQGNELLQLEADDGRMIGDEWITNEEILAGHDATAALGEYQDEAGTSLTGEGSTSEATGNSQEGSGQARTLA